MRWVPDFRKYLTRQVQALSGILIFAVIMSFFARWHWMTDIFSHFVLQYLIGAVILGVAFAALRQWKMAAVMIAIILISMIELRPQFYKPAISQTADPQFTILQYNRLFTERSHDDLKAFLQSISADVVVLQEASASLAEMSATLKDLYPYQIHADRPHPFGMVILSKNKFSKMESTPILDHAYANFIIRTEITNPHSAAPITLYALHAVPPVGSDLWRQRNFELKLVAERIAADNSSYIIFSGDWNITPYSPFFRDLLKKTKLNASHPGILPQPTWPSGHMIPALQIPIDHTLYSDSIAQITSRTFPAMGSDHYPTLSTFSLLPVPDQAAR